MISLRWLGAGLAMSGVIFLLLLNGMLKSRLEAAQAELAATKQSLEAALAAGGQMESRAAALAQSLTEAHAREASLTREISEREALIARAQTAARPDEEKENVVDAKTRRDAAARLNAAW